MNRKQERDGSEVEDLVGRLRAVSLIHPSSGLRTRIFEAPPSLLHVFGWVAALAASVILCWTLFPPLSAKTPTQIQIGQVVLKAPQTISPRDALRARYQNLKRGC